MIDEMPHKEFIDMMFFLINSDFEEYFEEEFDEELENDFQEFESPFSREMINFRCPNCKK
mgnify:CR=1 FL=1